MSEKISGTMQMQLRSSSAEVVEIGCHPWKCAISFLPDVIESRETRSPVLEATSGTRAVVREAKL